MSHDPYPTRCPLRCGQCCDYWREVPELVADAASRPNAFDCPHLGGRGCTLPRSERPEACLAYLCGVAEAVLEGSLTRATGMRLKEHGHVDVPTPQQRCSSCG